MERSTVGSLHRSTQAFCSQLCEKQTLEFGIAYYQPRHADLPEANQFREVVVDDPANLPRAFEEAERWFSGHGIFCYRWAPAAGQSGSPWEQFLGPRGFRPRGFAALALARWESVEPVAEVRVLHARAMRSALRETFPSAVGESSPSTRADAYTERLDDPSFDLFVATVDRAAAGRCALYQVGDIGRLMDLYVLPRFANANVDRALAGHVLSLAKRLQLRNIVAQVDESEPSRVSWFEQLGFVRDGRIVEFERDRG